MMSWYEIFSSSIEGLSIQEIFIFSLLNEEKNIVDWFSFMKNEGERSFCVKTW
jgi:hypothetical protein